MRHQIGESLFAEIASDGLVLTTEYGSHTTNMVVLGNESIGNLLDMLLNDGWKRIAPAPEKPIPKPWPVLR